MAKKVLFLCLVSILSASWLFAPPSCMAQNADNPALRTILNNFGARNFASGQPTRAELDLIIQAGLHAPSASNRQPWHFTVVQNQALVKLVVPQASDGNVLIVVSAAADNKTNAGIVLDCALAVQSIYLAAQALGLGSRIYTGPIDKINSDYKTDLGLDRNQNAVAVIRIGRLAAGVDAVSSASPRSSADQKVTYK